MKTLLKIAVVVAIIAVIIKVLQKLDVIDLDLEAFENLDDFGDYLEQKAAQ